MSNVCLPDGSCAEPGDVAYVSVPGGADNPMCGQATPGTKVMKALETTRPYVKLLGAIDKAVMINNRSVTLLATNTTLPRGSPGNIMTVDGTSNVKIYDLAINGASGNGSGILLPSGSMQTVTLGRVSMTANNGALGAVVASAGMVTIQRRRIFNNISGGISITAAQFDIENNFITGNGTDDVASPTSYGGISPFQTNTGMRTLSFNTISGNKGALDTATGVSCAGVTQDLTASNNTIYGNLVHGLGTQVGGNHCLWTYSDIGPGTTPAGIGNRNEDPKFVPGDFHLQSSSGLAKPRGSADSTCKKIRSLRVTFRSAKPLWVRGFQMQENRFLAVTFILVDQADPAATLGVDIDGDPRPQNSRRNIGADEYTSHPGMVAHPTVTVAR